MNCAIGNCDIEIIKILLMNEKLDINILNKLTSSKVYNNKAIINEDEEEEDENNSKTNISNEKTAIYLAVEKELVEIVKLLLTNDKIDVNIPYISKFNFLYIKFELKYISMELKINYYLNTVLNEIYSNEIM